MKKLDYIKLAIANKAANKKHWLYSVFATVIENSDDYQVAPYKYRLVRTPTSVSFLNESNELEKIDDASLSEPLFKFTDEIEADNNTCGNISGSVKTTLGTLITNSVLLFRNFGNRISYKNGSVSVKLIEKEIAKRLVSNNATTEELKEDSIKVSEYLEFLRSLQYIKCLAKIAVTAASVKTMTPPDGVDEFKEKLIKKYGDTLKDPVILAQYEKELQDYDNNYLPNDPANKAFLKGKVKDISRKRLHLTIGADAGFGTGMDLVPITNSLDQGWSTDTGQFVAFMNAARGGSYSRGAETVNGGVFSKALGRAGNNIKIEGEDCGITLGVIWYICTDNSNKLVGRYVLESKQWKLIETPEQAKQYIDKKVEVRSPSHCCLEGQRICKKCAGARLSKTPYGSDVLLKELSAIILNASMKAMHGKSLSIARIDIKQSLT